ncbi:ornithine cyclodeaminase family protein [Parasedimentitalea psychrophila]|uniref:Ornithine cyclodeaminase family protein n=1 Tax=Parasedimentitalea psychrophila TaxID=2997337 RepID=A0A9Y2KW69_9RHOB|nr:ornithine cyclodeaminase family protein [Parasedimentitalea psychrophila]WIY23803.1 ornithine cyclodeaminase family protein [Parasedimentitalea psychrophila]
MIHITEAQSGAAISHELAYEAVRRALIAANSSEAAIFPVVLGNASNPQNKFTIKSAADGSLAGLKVGSYFPTNDAAGLPRHDSIILLFDQTKGRIGAIVEAGKLNAYRTAAADAVATDALARSDSQVLALFGTGHQAAYEAQAIARIRPLTKIMVVGRNADRTSAFVAQLREKGLPAEGAQAETACRAADIIVTATTATKPLFQADWVRPGTHISSMGSDAIGKQELPPQLFSQSRLFCDLPEQSARIGEFQHVDAGMSLTAIGAALSDTAEGRRTAEEITIFDSSGIALQDLYIAESIIAATSS